MLDLQAKNIIWDSSKVPLGKEKQEMEIRKKEDPLSLITEWDKSRLKPIFKQFDKGNSTEKMLYSNQ